MVGHDTGGGLDQAVEAGLLRSLDQAKVAFVPGEAFGLAGYGRFSFALGDDNLVEGIERFAALVNG